MPTDPTGPATYGVDAAAMTAALSLPAGIALVAVVLLRRRLRRRTLAALFGAGGLATLALSSALSRALDPIETAAGDQGAVSAAAIEAFLFAAVPEESARFAVLLVAVATFRRVRGDAESAGLAVGLGFAGWENAFYSLLAPSALDVLIGRALPTVGHGAAGLIMGHLAGVGLSSAGSQTARRPRAIWFAAAWAAPVLLHGTYDFTVFLAERHDFSEPSDPPTAGDLKALGIAALIMATTAGVCLVEFGWAAWIAVRRRRNRRTDETIPA